MQKAVQLWLAAYSSHDERTPCKLARHRDKATYPPYRPTIGEIFAWVVAFGVSRLLQELGWVKGGTAYFVLATVVLIDAWLLARFFSKAAETDVVGVQ